MPYATKQDIIDAYGIESLFIADHDGDGTEDEVVIARALVAASDEIDGYLGARHTLPLPVLPPQLVQPCIDIAMYRMARDGASRTEEDRTRYEDAVKWLTKVADGKVRLVLPDTDEGAEFDRPKPIVAAGPERIFSREKMRGL